MATLVNILALAFVALLTHAKKVDLLTGNIRIKNFELTQCYSNVHDPITFKDVNIDFDAIGNLLASGTMVNEVNLTVPITAELVIKRHIGWWIEVPCERNLGSCTYNDLCAFGKPPTEKCPSRLETNHVPCRCPIPKGVYTLPKFISRSRLRSVWSGKYKGTIILSSNSLRLACYNMNFAIVDAAEL